MRIGILTFQYAYNYGALLQAYGLCKFLENLGHDVSFINLIPPAQSLKQKIRKHAGLLRKGYDMPLHMLKRYQFDKFRDHFLPLTKRCYNRSELEKVSADFDAVIVGSDQVWNGRFIKNVTDHYFLDFINNNKCRRISYAASFGDPAEKQPVEAIEAAKKYLKHFDSISVRDEISTVIVKDILGKRPDIVLDPSLLHDYKDISGCKNTGHNYIASYFISENHVKLGSMVLNHVSDRLKLPVTVIGNRMKGPHKFKKLIAAGPLEWLRLFHGASFICADSFHATIFAVKFKKPFITWCGFRPERARDFLKICGLADRQIDSSGISDIKKLIDSPIDYDAVFDRLHSHIGESRKFLENSLLSVK